MKMEYNNNQQSFYNTGIPISFNKKVQRKDAKSYQLVLEVEDWVSAHLIKQRKIFFGFTASNVSPYLPIVRCSNCQHFSHTEQNCRQGACEYCTKRHKSMYCPVKRKPQYHRCINCYGTPSDFPRVAS